MARWGLIVLAVCLAPVGLFGETLRAYGTNPGDALLKPVDGTTSPGKDLGSARNPQSPSLVRLCSSISGSVDVGKFHLLRDRLRAGVDGQEELSQIDSAVVQARHDCSSTQRNGNAGIVAELMHLLAVNWGRQGNLARADQLYQAAYTALENADNEILGKMVVLQDWANLKLVSGEPQRAEELTKLRTAEARKEYESGASSKEFSSDVLIDALEFQATVFEKIGLADEARTAEQEAEKLSAERNR